MRYSLSITVLKRMTGKEDHHFVTVGHIPGIVINHRPQQRLFFKPARPHFKRMVGAMPVMLDRTVGLVNGLSSGHAYLAGDGVFLRRSAPG